MNGAGGCAFGARAGRPKLGFVLANGRLYKRRTNLRARADKKEEAAKAEETAQLEKAARDLQQALAGVGGESMVTENLARHIVTRVTDEGLIV